MDFPGTADVDNDPRGVYLPLAPENAYLLAIFQRISALNPDRFVKQGELVQHILQRSPDRLFEILAIYCKVDLRLVDFILRMMERIHAGRVAPWYNSATAFTGRMLVKFSLMAGSVPSTLFIEGVSRSDRVEGMGSFGDVFRGTLRGHAVAVKRLRISTYVESDPQAWQKKLFREALIWQLLRHPYILHFIGLDRTTCPGAICMVSRWMSNGTIAKYLHDNPNTNIKLRAKWVLAIADGLSYLHTEHIVHGDFRCNNIFLSEAYIPYISDFGVSVIAEAGKLTMGVSTWAGTGALRWMAPEVLNSEQCTLAGDVYSFGCVCLEIACKEIPFPKLKTDRQVMSAILQGKLPEWPESSDSFQARLGDTARLCWTASRPPIHVIRPDVASLLQETLGFPREATLPPTDLSSYQPISSSLPPDTTNTTSARVRVISSFPEPGRTGREPATLQRPLVRTASTVNSTAFGGNMPEMTLRAPDGQRGRVNSVPIIRTGPNRSKR